MGNGPGYCKRVLKGGEDEIWELVRHTIQQVLEEEMTAFLNVEPYDRTELFEKALVQEISKSQVSALAKGLDAEIAAWRKRPLEAIDTRVPTHPKVAAMLDLLGEEMLAVYVLPVHHQRRMRTTNMIERFNEKSGGGRG